jgi:hypothetical protein
MLSTRIVSRTPSTGWSRISLIGTSLARLAHAAVSVKPSGRRGMAQRVFFLNTLKDGVDVAAYEDWVRRRDYPVARAQPAISSYVVTRLDGHVVEGTGLPCQYLEVIEVTSIEEYRAGLDAPELAALLDEWREYVGGSVAVYGEVIDG